MWGGVVVSFLFSQILGVTPKQVCRDNDVAEYLNLSSNRELFLYTIPKRDWEEPVEVELDFTLVSILSVQEKLQVVTFYFWLSVMWTNDFISWEPMDFCNIPDITLPTNLFWTPDIYIEERADEDKVTSSPFLYLSSSGSVFLFQSYRLTSSCTMHVHRFPFDKQKCNLTLGSSTYTEKKMKIKNTKSSKKASQESRRNYLTNGEWIFLDLRIIPTTSLYGEWNISTVVYEISMQRRSVLYVLVLILPTSVLFLLDLAISFTFAAPGEKIAFKVTLILQVSFLSMILTDKLPATSDDVPVIGTFFTGMFIFMVFGILENALILYLKLKKPVLPFFKGKNFVERILSKEKESEDPEINLGDEVIKQYDQAAELPDSEKYHEAILVFLRCLHTELEQIKKFMAPQEYRDTPESAQQEKTLRFIENVFCCVRLILSFFFLGYIITMWMED